MINNKPVKHNKQTKPINPTQQFIGIGLNNKKNLDNQKKIRKHCITKSWITYLSK